MSVRRRWAGIALVGATALAGPAFSQVAVPGPSAPPIRREVAAPTAPVNPAPDAGETGETGVGPEAREAQGLPPSPAAETAAAMSGSLNAQYAALRGQASPGALAPTAGIIPAVAMVAPAPLEATAPATPSVALARRVVESAAAFAGYMQRASAVRPDYTDAAAVTRAVRLGGTYQFDQIEEGAIAYVALAALQDPEFVRSMAALARTGQGGLAEQLAANPRLIMQAPGSATAAARGAKALGRMGSALLASGTAVKQSAYDIQHSAWSKAPVAGPEALLTELKARSAQREAMDADGGQAVAATLAALRSGEADGGSGRLTPVVAKGLTLAALAVLGEAGEEHADRVAALLTDADSAQCLKMARLNLYQCLSVAGPNYEDVFCLGRHAMMDTGQCVAQASGWTQPPQGVAFPIARPAPAPIAPARPASIMVPVALASAQALATPVGDPADVTPAGAPPPMGRGFGYPVQMAATGGER